MSAVDNLNNINQAIDAILGGAQEYEYNGKRIRRADLRVLMDERKRLEQQIAQESGSVAVAYFDRR